ncbi:threonyl-tRNA synthetase [Acetoanaerobium noterae]|uniref:Threonine--tRNA ligase n=2 Tax=root TaxID=1 RepID=A0A1T5C2T2_9FIRM|nr:threonine--tRNA ligase [Acetoanaerobium noterae]MBP8762401.1 threonine--tRNA ligase [Acetoanaerobium sp.]MBP9499624.1 threonine--tRNA ligase [Acetoanaerobium sp.]MBP9561815.1 threonine--tRNA ligase [Acetoanaerobium sp.]SKB53721.1 threonyl-tRNA synthetase [Acetoanaerobium noterae]
MIKIELKDGSLKEFESGIRAIDVANSISEGLARAIVGAKINGEVKDLKTPINDDAKLEFVKFEDKDGKEVFWHTSTHVMAQAIKRLYPEAKLAIGPAIENGFYYDIDLEHRLSPEDLEKIEAEMKKIVKEEFEVERYELPKDEAIDFMKKLGEDYKVELIEGLEEGSTISFYKQGEFTDLCAGPHLPNVKKVKAFKLLSVAGAYWRADQSNKMLQRVYGIAFEKKKDLDDYIQMMEEAKLRDHRKLGKELELFTLLDEGPGFPFFLPKGTVLKNKLLEYWREVHREDGYVEIETPIILNRQLWETSGHWFNYKENMYTVEIDEEDFAIKPMNCPGGMLVYQTKMRSYKDFPIRMGEIGRVHRHELSGALHGLMRVRAFTQDDAHIFMLPEQIKDEIKGVVSLIDKIYKTFGFSYHLELSTRPEKFLGEISMWDEAESNLKAALEELGLPYIINEGDGAFYGPKIDFHLRDCIGRTWQCGTIQLDYQLPERFELSYIGKDGEKHRPVMIHRVAFGSIERFIGILIEHYAGKFPLWIAPVQVKILPISDKFMDYAKQIEKAMYDAKIRVELDDRAEKIGYKIREAQLEKVPYMIIVGEKELNEGNISVRSRDLGDLGFKNTDDFLKELSEEIISRKTNQ